VNISVCLCAPPAPPTPPRPTPHALGPPSRELVREQEGEGCGGARGGAMRGHGEPARECEAAAPKRDVGLAELEPRAEYRVLLLRLASRA